MATCNRSRVFDKGTMAHYSGNCQVCNQRPRTLWLSARRHLPKNSVPLLQIPSGWVYLFTDVYCVLTLNYFSVVGCAILLGTGQKSVGDGSTSCSPALVFIKSSFLHGSRSRQKRSSSILFASKWELPSQRVERFCLSTVWRLLETDLCSGYWLLAALVALPPYWHSVPARSTSAQTSALAID